MEDKIKMPKRLIVIGGGAAGFFCAINAARMNPKLQVVLVEKSNKLLSKVRVSGGGRCNVTHACFDILEMSKKYPRGQHFVKKAFHQFFTNDTIQWFEERGVQLKTERDGRMFPKTDFSQTIIDCLLKEAEKYGVKIKMNAEVKSLQFSNENETADSIFQIHLSNSEIIESDFLTIACGGYPKSAMFDWLKTTGHTIENPVPSLFTFNLPQHPISKLMGVSVEKATIKIVGTKLEQEGSLLITHWGLSGPAVLKLSAWGARELASTNWHFSILVNWIPRFNEQTLRDKFQQLRKEWAAQKIFSKNKFDLPHRIWEFLALQAGIKEEGRWADLPTTEQNKFIKNLCCFAVEVKGKTTFKEEFVTAGGIKLNEIEASAMRSKKVPNLYFAGEVMDVDGVTGGFNFQHAWTSGWVAANDIAHLK